MQPTRTLLLSACALALLSALATCGKSSPGNVGGAGSSGTAGTNGSAGTSGSAGGNATAGTGASGAGNAGTTGSATGGSNGGSTGGGGSGGTGVAGGGGSMSTGGSAGGQTGGGGTAPPGTVSVLTQHNDNGRLGANTNETALTPANVNMAKFGKQFSQEVDGFIYAQPLYVPGVTIPTKGKHNVVYVATEHDAVYAFDADSKQAPLWQVSYLSAGVTAVPSVDASTHTLLPDVGITGTPVIDSATSTMYLVADTKEAGPKYVQRLHALDITTGAEKFGGPIIITASVNGMGANNTGATVGMVTLDPLRELQRPGLALVGSTVYIAFTGNGDIFHWHGWVLGYDTATLAQKSVYCTTPDADAGSIWQSGSGIAVDPTGNLYVETGNGSFDLQTGGRNASMSVLKLNPAGTTIVDWFAPHDALALSAADVDLGSSGPIVLPDALGTTAHPHLMIGSGKPGYLYLIDRDQMGHINADDSQIVQKVAVHPNGGGNGSGIFATPVYWNGFVYATAVGDKIKAFTLNAGVLSTTPVSQSLQNFSQPGALITLSANGTTAGIIWAAQGDGYQPAANAILHAYDATDLTKELWNSSQAPAMRDLAGKVVKNAMPTVANGRVYFGTQTELEVYGALP